MPLFLFVCIRHFKDWTILLHNYCKTFLFANYSEANREECHSLSLSSSVFVVYKFIQLTIATINDFYSLSTVKPTEKNATLSLSLPLSLSMCLFSSVFVIYKFKQFILVTITITFQFIIYSEVNRKEQDFEAVWPPLHRLTWHQDHWVNWGTQNNRGTNIKKLFCFNLLRFCCLIISKRRWIILYPKKYFKRHQTGHKSSKIGWKWSFV